jgi:hypothetical protein
MSKCGKKEFVKFDMFIQIVKHFTDTSDFQTLVWDMQNSSEGLPEKSQTVFSYLSKFVLMYIVFLYFVYFFFYIYIQSQFHSSLTHLHQYHLSERTWFVNNVLEWVNLQGCLEIEADINK